MGPGPGVALALVLVAAAPQEPPTLTKRELQKLARLTPLGAVPADPTNRVADDPDAAQLGQWLFFDPGLSGNGEVSCATCHDPATGFSDGKPVAETLGRGTRRTPSVINVAYLRWLFWDGRADSLWGQAVEPIENPIEMGGSRDAVARYLAGNEELSDAYGRVFGSAPSQDAPETVLVNVGKAIAAYERRLVRGDSPFDRYAAHLLGEPGGDPTALSASARRGLELFLGPANCTLCHAGPSLTDSEFHNTAAPPGEFGDPQDPGRYAGAAKVAASDFNAAGPYSDDPKGRSARRVKRLRLSTESFGEFRTPSLRNLNSRAPYMHAGQFPDLEAVVRFYSTLEGAAGRSHHQELVLTPLNLSKGQIADLVAFLESLEGRPLDPALTRQPSSPIRR
jgi:cytochrome c peroxidase